MSTNFSNNFFCYKKLSALRPELRVKQALLLDQANSLAKCSTICKKREICLLVCPTICAGTRRRDGILKECLVQVECLLHIQRLLQLLQRLLVYMKELEDQTLPLLWFWHVLYVL